jgi:hypothetical protein
MDHDASCSAHSPCAEKLHKPVRIHQLPRTKSRDTKAALIPNSATMPSATIERIDIPIVIIGGGCCGLTLSSILSDYDVEHILFERHPGTSYLPKVCRQAM